MSYSRWLGSRWYTYWVYKPDEDYNTATFCICRFEGSILFTAKMLREKFDKCLDTVRMKDTASEDEIEELAKYMTQFLKEVDIDYLGIK